jgi:hypothetical protein
MFERIAQEIVELHDFFTGWFTGELESDAFSRLEDSLDEDFYLISPSGDIDDRDALLESVRRAHGSRESDFTIRIEHIEPRSAHGDVHVATYEEIQPADATGPPRRLSTVVFAEDLGCPNGLRWLHVHEVALSR